VVEIARRQSILGSDIAAKAGRTATRCSRHAAIRNVTLYAGSPFDPLKDGSGVLAAIGALIMTATPLARVGFA